MQEPSVQGGPRRIWILTLFPEYFTPLLKTSGVIARALSAENSTVPIEIEIIQIRDYAGNRYGSVDDSPFGGAPGMIMRADVLQRALVEGVLAKEPKELKVVLLSPRGKRWGATLAHEYAQGLGGEERSDLAFICGRYEGVDERFISKYVQEEISIGDYVLSGGEIALLAVLDSMLRLVPGVLGNSESLQQESFNGGLLEPPQYTRPRTFEGMEVPDVLLSGHHLQMKKYQEQMSIETTKRYRPDLYEEYEGAKAKREKESKA
ncbi:MAG: tRNA (guanosine(37)-N1)-methyltransferase TrmD [Oligoflexia bacterium]|nr:tRNA (guanosine(37)-N1)-methyltransferase TrmD [Oligoflexia bacterium]